MAVRTSWGTRAFWGRARKWQAGVDGMALLWSNPGHRKALN
jgi:hypothetical protein